MLFQEIAKILQHLQHSYNSLIFNIQVLQIICNTPIDLPRLNCVTDVTDDFKPSATVGL